MTTNTIRDPAPRNYPRRIAARATCCSPSGQVARPFLSIPTKA